MIKVTCHHCKHIWKYKGKSQFYACCPKCHYQVNIRKLSTVENFLGWNKK